MELPALTQTALAGLRRVEDAAAGPQVRRARAASSRLLHALIDAGWPVSALIRPMGRTDAAIRRRVARVPLPQGPPGVDIPRPAVLPRRVDPHTVPLDQREWLRPIEAAELLAVHGDTLSRWRRAGLLPRTIKRPQNNTHLFYRGDLIAIVQMRTGRRNLPNRAMIEKVDDPGAGLRSRGNWSVSRRR